MPNISGSFSAKVKTQTSFSLSDLPNHELNLAEITGLQKSTDDNWNNGRLAYWGLTDLLSGSGSQRGYFVTEHVDGDRDWGTFEGKVTTAGGQVTLEGTWRFTGGTGKFNGLSGSGTFKGRMPSPLEVEMTWEGAYQLAAAAAGTR